MYTVDPGCNETLCRGVAASPTSPLSLKGWCELMSSSCCQHTLRCWVTWAGWRIWILSRLCGVVRHNVTWFALFSFFFYYCCISAFSSSCYLQSHWIMFFFFYPHFLSSLIYKRLYALWCLSACALNNQLNSTDNPTLRAHKTLGLVFKAWWASAQGKFISLHCSSYGKFSNAVWIYQ